MSAVAMVLACAASTTAAGATSTAERGATLSVQRGAATAAPQVRSVQRDASDNEVIVAGANETVEVLLADGTSVTLSPGTRLVLERYRYDRGSRLGELELRLESGAVRVIGGVLNNSSAVVVRTPSGVATLDNAVAYLQVGETQTEIALVAGRGINVAGAGESRALAKAGTAVALDPAGKFAGATRSLNRAELEAYSDLVNPGLSSGVVPTFVVDNAASSSAILASTSVAAAEDRTAKDDKFGPVLPDPTAPTGVCNGGSCVAQAPNLDIAGSIGTVGNRQTGRTIGATWRRQYQQGETIATQGILRGFAPDFSAAGDGRRDATARIFAANGATPYSVTFGTANPATSASDYGALTCFGSSGAGCLASPIVNLYDGTSGPVYRVAGIGGGEPAALAEVMHLAFPDARMQEPVDRAFDAYALLATIAFDLDRPGALITQSVNQELTGCVQTGNSSCVGFDEYEDADARYTAIENWDYGPYSPQPSASLFSNYRGQAVPVGDCQGGADPCGVTVVFEGQTAYDISSLMTGFRRVPIRNYESSMNTVCGNIAPECTSLAVAMFGERFPGALFPEPRLNQDVTNEFFDPENPEFGEETSDVMVRDPDSFLALDMVSRLPGDNQRLFYATGSVSGRLSGGAAAQGATLDTFRLSAGLDASAVLGRAFLRPETLLAITPASLLSSGLLVLNAPYTATVNAPSRALHYDFAAVGDGANQTSTLSVTLGTLAYNPAANSAQFSGRTVGSIARSGASRYSGSVQSALLSTSAGGGNPNIANTGRAGYLVLENYDPVSTANGGIERTIENGAATQTNYATLRVGQVLAGGSQAAPANRIDSNLTGYAAGLAEVTAATGGAVELAALTSSDFQLTTNAAQGTVGATLAASVGTSSATLNFGSSAGASGLSAYTGAKEFAAMTGSAPNLAAGAIADATGANAAIVSGAPLIGSTAAQGWSGNLDAATRSGMSTNAANATGYRYLQWGFFFGDFNTAAGRSAHTHLTSWVAGRATPEGTALPGGTADYLGHVFANVSNGNQLYSAAGSFANQWNFATRSGTGTMSFDGQDYSFVTRLEGLQRVGSEVTSDSTARFEGLISTPTDAGYIGSLAGSFVADPAATTDPLALRSGMMGQFQLSRTLDGSAYRAVGTFAGERPGN